MITSGETAIATTDDTPVDLLASGTPVGQITVVNEGATPGFFSIDSGISWARLPAQAAVVLQTPGTPQGLGSAGVKVKRVSGGANLSGVYGFAV